MRLARTIVAAVALLTTALAQDSLQLKDGRFIFDKKISKHDAGAVIHFENGDVIVPKAIIRECTAFDVQATDSSYTPAEQAKIDKGLVPFEGKWMKPKKRDTILGQRRSSREKRITEARAHQNWRDRYELKTKNFHFHYTIDPEVMKRYADMLEVYYKTFTRTWGIKKPKGMGRLKVCFYHDADYFHQVGGAPRGVIGYFRFVKPIELNFYYERLDEALTQDVLFHEANHYLTHLIDPMFHYPSWVNESLAEYYGASEWDADKKKMIIGNLQEGRLAVLQDAIRNDEWQGLEDLIRLPQRSFNAIHYAWGWSFVHYLMSDKKSAKAFKKFYLALGRDKSIKRVPHFSRIMKVEPEEQIRVFKKFMKVKELSEFEAGWHAYVKGLRAASGDGYRRAGDIALARGMPLKAQRYFKTALEMGDKNCMTHFGYGRALYQKSKYKEAREQFELAIGIDPLQGRFWMYLADAKEKLKAQKADIERMRNLALEIDPDDYSLMLRLVARGKERVAK
ncbi:MAG: tetratricopeptide repeat protein [bacterium]|nr:tetratricopeptide repeat protein [bacterium]